jgi:hypothetical protein
MTDLMAPSAAYSMGLRPLGVERNNSYLNDNIYVNSLVKTALYVVQEFTLRSKCREPIYTGPCPRTPAPNNTL